MFRGKESSNRIELSRLVQDLLNFAVSGSLQLWGGGRWVGGASGGMGGVPTHTQMHAHARTCTHAHLYMYRNCKWPPTWRHPCLACLAEEALTMFMSNEYEEESGLFLYKAT